MRIYQLKTAKEFYNSIKGNFTTEELMQMYAEDVAKKFAAECVRLGEVGDFENKTLKLLLNLN
jgi:hypothetical protein